ncbi:MAG: cysteine--tRNA ligase, partial [bacterium]|nr:cysteine--tRNA ligase [bacterium]
KREGKHPLEIAKQYETAFFDDLKKLNILPPTKLLRATESIKEQIEIIKILEQKGFTYKDESAIYFDTSKFQSYGKLAGQKLQDKKIGAREEVVVDKRKKNSADFVLWFFLAGRYKNHVLRWPSPWGEGFPGWHIECSAISRHLLGQPFDIHAGGEDHIGTHHTNEMAQSEAAFGIPLANLWVHGAFMLIDSGRMGKSLGNFIRLQDLVDRGYSPLAYRYFTFGAHYRSQLNFTWEAIEAAQNALDDLYAKISELDGSPTGAMCPDYEHAFEREINDDLNMPRALSLVWRLIKKPNPDKLKLATLKQFDRVLGLDLLAGAENLKSVPKEIKELAKERERVRQEKNFKEADVLRVKIEQAGYTVRDTPQGPVVRKKEPCPLSDFGEGGGETGSFTDNLTLLASP